jgi:hypothetical protein
MNSRILDNYKVVFVDIDETLAMANLSEFPVAEATSIEYGPEPIWVVPNKKNLNLVQKFYKLGYSVIFWSKTGSDWALAVAKSFGIDHMVTLYLTKPQFYIDDQPCENWMGRRCWRDPKTGEETL